VRVALVTAPPEEAKTLAKRLVESSLAACVNVVPAVTSIYRWKGEIHSDSESLLIAKVRDEDVETFVEKVVAWHSYECPECICLDVREGHPAYLAWVENPSVEP
jgi:periplasmic divalent cation tolerance protein